MSDKANFSAPQAARDTAVAFPMPFNNSHVSDDHDEYLYFGNRS